MFLFTAAALSMLFVFFQSYIVSSQFHQLFNVVLSDFSVLAKGNHQLYVTQDSLLLSSVCS